MAKKVAYIAQNDQSSNDNLDALLQDPALVDAVLDFLSAASSGAHLPAADLLATVLTLLGIAHRRVHLQKNPDDRANGFYSRNLSVGPIPVTVQVPTTRSSNFRPAFLPPRYKRSLPQLSEDMLAELLMAASSASALAAALRSLGVSAPPDDIRDVQKAFAEELQLLNSAQIEPDYIALWLDGKYFSLKIDNHVVQAVVYNVIALTTSGHRRVLACKIIPGKETADSWHSILQDLYRRGLRRVLITIHDDLPGLSEAIRKVLPYAFDQLCLVHIYRNIRRRVSSRDDASRLNAKLRAIGQLANDPDDAIQRLEEVCQQFQDLYPRLTKDLRRKASSIFSFTIFPTEIRAMFSSTNVVESFNSQLAKQIANSGGYFQSEHIAHALLGMRVTNLHQGRWAKPLSKVVPHLPYLLDQLDQRYTLIA